MQKCPRCKIEDEYIIHLFKCSKNFSINTLRIKIIEEMDIKPKEPDKATLYRQLIRVAPDWITLQKNLGRPDKKWIQPLSTPFNLDDITRKNEEHKQTKIARIITELWVKILHQGAWLPRCKQLKQWEKTNGITNKITKQRMKTSNPPGIHVWTKNLSSNFPHILGEQLAGQRNIWWQNLIKR